MALKAPGFQTGKVSTPQPEPLQETVFALGSHYVRGGVPGAECTVLVHPHALLKFCLEIVRVPSTPISLTRSSHVSTPAKDPGRLNTVITWSVRAWKKTEEKLELNPGTEKPAQEHSGPGAHTSAERSLQRQPPGSLPNSPPKGEFRHLFHR